MIHMNLPIAMIYSQRSDANTTIGIFPEMCCTCPNGQKRCSLVQTPTLIARIMRPTRGPPGSCRPRWAPCRPHRPCYQGNLIRMPLVTLCDSHTYLAPHWHVSMCSKCITHSIWTTLNAIVQYFFRVNVHTVCWTLFSYGLMFFFLFFLSFGLNEDRSK